MTDSIRKTGIQLGLLLGAVLIALSAYIYFIDLKLFTNVLMGTLTIVITVLFGIISILFAKKKRGGYITFKEAFSSYFFTIVTGKAISCIFALIVSSFILSPANKQIIKQDMFDFSMNLMKVNEAPAKDIEKTTAMFKTYDPFLPSEIITPAIKYLLRDCLIGFLVALIIRNKRVLAI